jgi:hypothetical protein
MLLQIFKLFRGCFMRMAGQRKNIIRILVFSCAGSAAALFCASPAHAYLDPGTGSMIIQAIAAAVLTAGAMLGVFWRSVKNFLLKFGRRKDDAAENAAKQADDLHEN